MYYVYYRKTDNFTAAKVSKQCRHVGIVCCGLVRIINFYMLVLFFYDYSM
jgi:hypothetical protein